MTQLLFASLLVLLTLTISGPVFCGQIGVLDADSQSASSLCIPSFSGMSSSSSGSAFYCEYTCPTNSKQYAVKLTGYVQQALPYVCTEGGNMESKENSQCPCGTLV
jgi:hypothetical protein